MTYSLKLCKGFFVQKFVVLHILKVVLLLKQHRDFTDLESSK